jgi:Flp pilus assembly protein TadB
VSARAVLTACGVIFVACYAAALLTPAPFLALVEFSLLALVLAVLVAAAVWRRRLTALMSTFPSPAPRRLLSRARPRRANSERH